jgi:hypothetical protein
VGGANSNTITASYWDKDTSGLTKSAGGIGLTTIQMQTFSTFFDAGWDFMSDWMMCDGVDYPHLLWEGVQCTRYGGGSGSSDDPYQIWTAEQMNTIGLHAEDWSKSFILMADLDLGGYVGTQYNCIGNDYNNSFKGNFNGNGHIIRNFTYITTDTIRSVGLFGAVGNGATIKNLGLVDVNISVAGGNVGGLIGINYEGILISCYTTGMVTSGYVVGGLVGNNSGTITYCYSTCMVNEITNGGNEFGGLVGENYGTIISCYSGGSVRGETCAGGIVGRFITGEITSCYSDSDVSGHSRVAGLVGKIDSGFVNSCYCTGKITVTDYVTEDGYYFGGLVGENQGVITSCFWDIDTTGQAISGGGTGYPTSVMKQKTIYTGWDFTTDDGNPAVWIMPTGGYPILSWQPWAMLITPNGGESYMEGATQDITWSATGISDQVSLQYSVDNSSTWIDIATVSNTGTYPWVIPNILSNTCLVKISSVDDPSIFDISDAPFSIVKTHVYFADANLKLAVEAKLGVTNPTESDMLKLTSLTAKSKGITSIIGLETALNLGTLSLDTNNVSDITPLAGLNKLTVLTLYSNKITDISPLAGLTKLYYLVFSANKVSDISSLAGLNNLIYLYLNSNQINDFSALTYNTKFKEIYAAKNAILTKETYLTHIPAIRANNPNLTVFQYDPGCQTFISGDVNQDCHVNLSDLAVIASNWLKCNHIYEEMCP